MLLVPNFSFHQIEFIQGNHASRKPPADYRHRCTICPYSSNYTTNLKAHIRTHTGEKPFKCSLCHFSASQKITIKHHELIHRKHEDAHNYYLPKI